MLHILFSSAIWDLDIYTLKTLKYLLINIWSNNSSLQVDGSHCLYIYLLHWIYKNYALLAEETLFKCFLIFDYLEFIRL